VIVLDANVVSELMRRAPEPQVVGWVDEFPTEEVFITAVTAAELLYGVARLPDGRRKRELFDKVDRLLAVDFDEQVSPFDGPGATNYADIVAARERAGLPISMADAADRGDLPQLSAALATSNIDDFADTGVDVVNPWHAGEPQ
jgi:predicted nucleic acid-binding protein